MLGKTLAITIWSAITIAVGIVGAVLKSDLLITLSVIGLAAGVVIFFINKLATEPNKTTCRGCGQAKDERLFALTYGESEGLCRECLDKYLPLALKAQEKEVTKV